MLYIFKFPDIGEGVTEGRILEWFVKPGQAIEEGDAVVKVETDKVIADIPSPRTGTVKNTFGKVGDIINVEDALIEIEIEGDAGTDQPTTEEPVEEVGYGVVGVIEDATSDAFLPATGEGMEAVAVATQTPTRQKTLATPVARKMAVDLGLDINEVRGSGPGGRVMKNDIRRAVQDKQSGPGTGIRAAAAAAQPKTGQSASPRTTTEPLSQIRKTIAARMVESKFTAPHAASFEEVEISKLIEIRRDNAERFAADGVKLTYLPFILKAVVSTLKQHPQLNCRLDMNQNQVVYNHFYDIGVATDTPDGLLVPVIKDADQKSVVELARDLADKAERGRTRKLALDELRDSTFSITNYGSIAGIHATPIINYPNVAILGVGRIHRKPVVKGDEIVPGHILPLSLAIDHRIVDGADAARFMKDLMAWLSDPVALLLA